MAPHSESATYKVLDASAASISLGKQVNPGETVHTPAFTERQIVEEKDDGPYPPTFDDKYKERQYQKERLALAFRIFAKFGFDEGVAGHITLRVRGSLNIEPRETLDKM